MNFPIDAFGDAYTKRFDYDANSNLIYAGVAVPGTASSAARWAIRRYTYSGANVTLIQVAGAGEMAYSWDNRTSLSYA